MPPDALPLPLLPISPPANLLSAMPLPAGCLPPGGLADYRAKFEALPTHAERLEHLTTLKALIDAGLWDTVKRRIRLALLP